MRCRVVFRAACAAVAMAIVCCSWAVAGTNASVSLPRPAPQPTPYRLGLSLDVESEWVQGNGHRPVHLTLKALRAAAEDRAVTVELGVGYWNDNNYVAVSQELVLPAGSTSLEKWVLVPQHSWGQVLGVRTLAGGRQIDELSDSGLPLTNHQYLGNEGSCPRILFVSDSPPDVTAFNFIAGNANQGLSLNFQQLRDVFALTHLKRDQLFDQWIYYSAVDFIFLSLDDARHLAASRPDTWRALSEWTRAGGVLCVFGTGRDDAQLADVEKLLGLPAEIADSPPMHRGWQAPAADVLDTHVRQAIEADLAAEAQQQASATGSTPTAPAPITLTAPADAPFLWRPAGMGQVVAFPEAQPFPGEGAHWRWLFASVAPNNSRWAGRYGVQGDSANPGFNEFLIADVGLPPIRSYRVLITVFVVFIGPVNYWLLRRAGRLHLFLFTVPLAALITSAGLLGYALMSDGLVSRLRSRSVTYLDQPAAMAASAARLSYYAAFAPAAGLTFPDDTLVIPYELEAHRYYNNSRSRRMTWTDAQHLTRGWLAARTPTQYITQRAYPCKMRLDVSPPDAQGARNVTNRLGVPLVELLARDEAGAWYSATQLDPEKSTALTTLPDEAAIDPAAARFIRLLQVDTPRAPEGLDGAGSQSVWGWFGYHHYGGSGFAIPSLLEDGFSQIRSKLLTRDLGKRTYVAIVERPADIVPGLDDLTESQSRHVIIGNW